MTEHETRARYGDFAADKAQPLSAANASTAGEAAMLRPGDAVTCPSWEAGHTETIEKIAPGPRCSVAIFESGRFWPAEQLVKVKPPATVSEGACECPHTKALESILSALPLDSVSRTVWHDDDGTVVYHPWYLKAQAALSAPCPREGLRGELKRERNPRCTGSLAWTLANRTAERNALQAECESLRAELQQAKQDALGIGEVFGKWLDGIGPYSIPCPSCGKNRAEDAATGRKE